MGIPPTVTFDSGNVFPTRYDGNRTVQNHSHEPPALFASMFRSQPSGGVSEGPNPEPNFPNDTPCQRNDLLGAYPFESEQPSPLGEQGDNSNGAPFLPHSLGEGPSRYGGVGASFQSPLLPPHPEQDHLDNQYKSHHSSFAREASVHDGAGPSESRIISLVSSFKE